MSSERSVVVVENDSMVRDWVRIALEGTEFRIAGEATTADAAVQLMERRAPALLVVDYRLPDGTGTELVRRLRQAGLSVPAIIFTASPERGLNEAAREAGAQGTMLKTGKLDELLETLRAVADGEQRFDARHPPRPVDRGGLSPREREVLRLVAAGATNRDIAHELGVGEETVKTLVARTFAKLGVKRRAEAVSVAHDRGIL